VAIVGTARHLAVAARTRRHLLRIRAGFAGAHSTLVGDANMTLPLSLAILCPVLGISEFGLFLMKRSKANVVSKDRQSLKLNWILSSAGFGLAMFCAIYLPALAFPWREPVEMSGILTK
jgi:hypothetical protein